MNIDCVLSLESPKIIPFKIAIRHRIAELLQVQSQQINIKAKTGKGIGSVGHGEVVDARCVALLESTAPRGSSSN